MNFFSFYLSRTLAFVVIGILMIGVQTAGGYFQQRRDAAGYERLAAAVCDGGTGATEWWFWPPQAHLSGRYHGRAFHYQKTPRMTTHLLVNCMPAKEGDFVRHGQGKSYTDTIPAALSERFPNLISFYAVQSPVSWRRRSLDRRPLGLGREPGIDLYQQNRSAFDPRTLIADLEGLQSLCRE